MKRGCKASDDDGREETSEEGVEGSRTGNTITSRLTFLNLNLNLLNLLSQSENLSSLLFFCMLCSCVLSSMIVLCF